MGGNRLYSSLLINKKKSYFKKSAFLLIVCTVGVFVNCIFIKSIKSIFPLVILCIIIYLLYCIYCTWFCYKYSNENIKRVREVEFLCFTKKVDANVYDLKLRLGNNKKIYCYICCSLPNHILVLCRCKNYQIIKIRNHMKLYYYNIFDEVFSTTLRTNNYLRMPEIEVFNDFDKYIIKLKKYTFK